MTRCDGGTVPLRSSEWLRYLAFVVTIISWASQTIGGQTASSSSNLKVSSSVPRTADGQPDLQGVWDYGTETPLQRPDELAGKERLTPDEAARYDQQMAARRKERQNGKP